MASCNVLKNFSENLEIAIRQIKDGEQERKSDTEFRPEEYWDKLGKQFKAMSHEATKLSLAFSAGPVPTGEALESLISSVERNTLAFVSVYYGLPKSQGLHLRKSTQKAVASILEDLHVLVKTIIDCGAGSPDQLQNTGVVWQDADVFPSIPKDNKQVVLAETSAALGLVSDALTEIQEAAESDSPMEDMLDSVLSEDIEEQNENTWSESDKTLLGPCLGLIKVSKSLLKKCEQAVRKNGGCENLDRITELDDIGDDVGRLSPVVDDFILSLYPPMERSNVQESAKELYSLNGKILDFVRKSHFTNEDDEKWVTFLTKANTHNWDNILKETVDIT